MTSEFGLPDGNKPDIEEEFHTFLDNETLFDIEADEHLSQTAIIEDALMTRLLDDGFPLVPQILEINTTKFNDKHGLTPLYDFLVEQVNSQSASSPEVPSSNEEASIDRQTAYLMSSLVSAVQILAAAKSYQDTLLNHAQVVEDNGSTKGAESLRQAAFEARKEVEAQLLTNESLGPKVATRILLIASPEFKGDSLLPLTEDSESYIMMYRLKQEKFYDTTDEVKAYATKAREILETKVKPGQIQHPEFDDFAFSLCWAISRSILGEQHTVGLSTEQIDAYRMLIKFRIDEALKKAPELGIEADTIQELYESIISELI